MADRYDELAETQQAATTRMLETIRNQAVNKAADYARHCNEGNADLAAYAQRNYNELAREYNSLLGAVQQQAMQAQQQQRQQVQLTPEEAAWIRDNPQVWNDPKKRAEVTAAWNSLALMNQVKPGSYPHGSQKQIALIEHWAGLRDADGSDSNEVLCPEEVLRISQSRHGEITGDEIAEGTLRVAEMKKMGFYRPRE